MEAMAIRSNFKTLRANLEAKQGRRISYKEIVEAINKKAQTRGEKVSEPTLVRFANNRTTSVSYRTLEGLIEYFTTNGLECEPGDLLIHESSNGAAA